jgi:hypothetical protein
MTKMANLDFDECYKQKQIFNDEGLLLPVVHISNLVDAKKAAGRNKDLDDLQHLPPFEE